MIRLLVLLIIVCGFGCGVVFADDQMIAEGARLGKTCAGCHGTDGASPGNLIPIIGGQMETYLAKTMDEFSADKRPGSVMLNLAKGYTVAQQKQIAAYFSIKPWVNTKHAVTSNYDTTLVKSCSGCHGANGSGRGSFPRLAGQHPDYLTLALMEYKQGERTAATMKLVTRIDDVTLKQMADFYSSLK